MLYTLPVKYNLMNQFEVKYIKKLKCKISEHQLHKASGFQPVVYSAK